MGVTPSAWWSVFKAIQFGDVGSVYSGSGVTSVGHNTFFDGTNSKRLISNPSSLYLQTAGNHQWYNAADGAANSNISFTQAMTLDASGRLALGRITADHRLDVQGNILVRNTSANASFYLAQEGDNSSTYYQYNNGTLRNVIASNGASYFTGGNVGIGTPSPTYRLQIANNGNTLLQLNGNNTAGTLDTGFTISADDSKNIYLYQRESAATIFATSNTEAMRIFAGQNVHIGPTPASDNGARLQVSGRLFVLNQVIANNTITDPTNNNTLTNGTVYALNGVSTVNNFGIGLSGLRNENYDIWFQTGSVNGGGYRFYRGTTELLTIANSGNLGLGVTPSAWDGTLIRAIQITDNGGSISSFSTGNTSSKFTFVSNNAFYDNAGWKYATNGSVAQYRLANDNHQWFNAPSGTAGAAISFTQAMTLTAAGRLLINTPTEASYMLDVNGTGRFKNTTEINVFSNDYGNNLLLSNGFPNNGIATSISFGHNTQSAEPDIMARISGFVDDRTSGNRKGSLSFITASTGTLTEQMRITSGGNVLIGTGTSGASKLRIVGLPTSSAGLSSGDVYNLSGVLMIA